MQRFPNVFTRGQVILKISPTLQNFVAYYQAWAVHAFLARVKQCWSWVIFETESAASSLIKISYGKRSGLRKFSVSMSKEQSIVLLNYWQAGWAAITQRIYDKRKPISGTLSLIFLLHLPMPWRQSSVWETLSGISC